MFFYQVVFPLPSFFPGFVLSRVCDYIPCAPSVVCGSQSMWVSNCACHGLTSAASTGQRVSKDWRSREHAWWRLFPGGRSLLPSATVVFGFNQILTDGFSLFLFPRKLYEGRHYWCRPWTQAGKSEADTRAQPVPSLLPPRPARHALRWSPHASLTVSAAFLSLTNCKEITEHNTEYFFPPNRWVQH